MGRPVRVVLARILIARRRTVGIALSCIGISGAFVAPLLGAVRRPLIGAGFSRQGRNGGRVLRVRALVRERREILCRAGIAVGRDVLNCRRVACAVGRNLFRHRLEVRDVLLPGVLLVGDLFIGIVFARLGDRLLVGERALDLRLGLRLFDGSRVQDHPHRAQGDRADGHEGKDQLFDRRVSLIEDAIRRRKGGNSVSLGRDCRRVKPNFP